MLCYNLLLTIIVQSWIIIAFPFAVHALNDAAPFDSNFYEALSAKSGQGLKLNSSC